MPATPKRSRATSAATAATAGASPTKKKNVENATKTNDAPVKPVDSSFSFELFRDFLRSFESLCWLDGKAPAFRIALGPHLPIKNTENAEKIVESLKKAKLLDDTLYARMIHQLRCFLPEAGAVPTPSEKKCRPSALKPAYSECINCKKSKQNSPNFLYYSCSNCGLSGDFLLFDAPASLYWHSKVLANQEKIKEKQNTKEKTEETEESKETPKEVAAKSIPQRKNSPIKKKLDFESSELQSSPSTASEFDGQLNDLRTASALRAIDHLSQCVQRCKKSDFHFHGGDIIFLLRNAIYRAGGNFIGPAAEKAVKEMLNKWDSYDFSSFDEETEPEHLLGFVECLHGQLEMKWKSDREIHYSIERIRKTIKQFSLEDLIRFDPAGRKQLPLTSVGYCVPCGTFGSVYSQKICSEPRGESKDGEPQECGAPLARVVDYQHLCEALVWTSVFRDISIDPLNCADGSASLDDVLKFLPQIRPYQSLKTLGFVNYQLQCYFLTHLMFILSGWGGWRLEEISQYFIEEFLFLYMNLPVVIGLQDPELVGEFLCSLKILGLSDDHMWNRRGHMYLLATEKSGPKQQGNWVAGGAEFHKRYHTAYCGLIGLKSIKVDPEKNFQKSFPERWRKYFLSPLNNQQIAAATATIKGK